MNAARRSVLLMLALAGPVAAQQIAVKPAAVVKGASYTLGELAEITGANAGQAQHLAALSVGTSPRVGTTEWLQRALLEKRVRALTGSTALRWSGPQAIQVERAAATVAGAEITDRAAVYLYGMLAGEHQRVSIQPVEELPDVPVNDGRISLSVRPLQYSEALRKRAKVWVDVHVDGAFNRSVPVQFAVEVWRETWVTGQAVSAGEAFDCSLLQRRMMDVAALPAATVATLGLPGACGAQGIRARSTLEAGDPVTRTAWAAPGHALPGERVALRATGHGVTVEVPAQMLNEGSMGRRVRVRYADRVLDAEVRGPGLVQLSNEGV